MDEGVAFSFLGKLVELMVDPIVRQFRYLFFYNNNIENLEQELKDVQAARDGVKRQVVAAENNIETIDPAMQLWLERADEIERKASIIIEHWKSKVEKKCLNLGCPDVKQRYLLSRKAIKLIDGIGKHKGDGVKYARSTHLAPPPGIVSDDAFTPELPTWIAISQSTTSSEGFESRKTIVEKVMVALKDDGIRMIGICGIGGVGKTTMANEVCRRAKAEGLFEQFAMTSVSQTQDLLKIQKELAGMLGLTLDDGDTILLRAPRLHERLSKGRKILVILDDVWEELPLQKVGIPTGCKGCKVICTSRNKDVLSDMGTHIFDVRVLTDTESWDLFEANAGNVRVTTDLYATAKKIVEKCGGLPIAIVTLARALKNKKKHEWDTALRRLEKSTGEKIRGMAEYVYKCIEFSYEFLKDSGAKTLLLLCCLFPEDADIPIEILVRFKDFPALEVTEDEVRTLVGDLIGSNLLLGDEENERVVKMHDIVREVCLYIEGLNKFQQPSIGMANRRFISRRSAFFEEKRSQAFKQVMNALADDQISTIGIGIHGLSYYGWGSIVMDEVIEKVKEGNLFDDVAMVGKVGVFEMQGDLARKLGLADSVRGVTSISERAKQLRARLTDGRRRLIIIHSGDLGNNYLEKVGIPVGAEHNKKGCKVAMVEIVSEFDQDVCLRTMGSEKIIRFERFSTEEELVLLREHGRFDEEIDPIAKQIVEILEGHPWAIVRLGEALKNQNKNVWLDALHRLKNQNFVIAVVGISYNSLSSSQAKMLLLLVCCIISGRGNDIPMEKLVVMWVKLFKVELEAARNKVMDLLQELHTRFLIQIGFHENTVSVDPFIREVVVSDLLRY